MKKGSFAILTIWILFLPMLLVAQSGSPKIGLALSGGGARGIAHIGVLQVLDEAGLKPDCITGVSMGSIVGGLYAAGYSADSIARIFKAEDFDVLLSDQISEREVVFSEKENYRNQFIAMGIRGKSIQAPGGLIEGQKITTMLNHYCFPVHMIKDFDSLPIPFRAVATDIVNCKPFVLDHGSLAMAMRASMAVPTAFSPVEIDSTLLVDGGVVRNFAVEELQAMGAELIIGSYTGRRLLRKDELGSLTSVMAQTASFAGLFDAEVQKQNVDLLIKHDLDLISTADFHLVDSLIKIGYQSALPFKEEFTRMANLRKRVQSPNEPEPFRLTGIAIDSIEVVGNTLVSDAQIIRELKIESDSSYDQSQLTKRMDYLYGLLHFDQIHYEIVTFEHGNILRIICKEKSPQIVNLSLHYDKYLGFGINFNYLHRNLFIKNSKLTVDGLISNFFRINPAYCFVFGQNRNWYLEAEGLLSRDRMPALLLDNRFRRFNNIEVDFTIGVNRVLGYSNRIGFETGFENMHLSPEILEADTWMQAEYNNWNTSFTFTHNSLDQYFFPRKGVEIDFNLSNIYLIDITFRHEDRNLNDTWKNEGTFFFDSYYRVLWRSRYYIPLHKKLTTSLRLNGVLTTKESYDDNNFALIGGYDLLHKRGLPFIGFHASEILSKNAVGGGLSLHYHLLHNLQITGHANAYYVENLRSKELEAYYGYGFELGYMTVAGPLRLGFMHGFYPGSYAFPNIKLYIGIGF